MCFLCESRYCNQWDLSLATFLFTILIYEMSDNFGMLFIYSDRRSCEFKRKTKLDKTQVNLMLFLESFYKKTYCDKNNENIYFLTRNHFLILFI